MLEEQRRQRGFGNCRSPHFMSSPTLKASSGLRTSVNSVGAEMIIYCGIV